MMANPESRHERFIQGLDPDLACFVNIYPGTTIEFLIDKAGEREECMHLVPMGSLYEFSFSSALVHEYLP
jgi:hypothetical protein